MRVMAVPLYDAFNDIRICFILCQRMWRCCWIVMEGISAQVAAILLCSLRHQAKYDVGQRVFHIVFCLFWISRGFYQNLEVPYAWKVLAWHFGTLIFAFFSAGFHTLLLTKISLNIKTRSFRCQLWSISSKNVIDSRNRPSLFTVSLRAARF